MEGSRLDVNTRRWEEEKEEGRAGEKRAPEETQEERSGGGMAEGWSRSP